MIRYLVLGFVMCATAGMIHFLIGNRGGEVAHESSAGGGRAVSAAQPAEVRPNRTNLAVQRRSGNSEKFLQNVLTDASLDARGKALALLKAVPGLPAAEQLDACEHALLLLDDEVYQPAFELLVADGTGEAIRQLLMEDLSGRSQFLRLPYLVRLAGLEDHPFSEEAKVELITTVGDDYGTNWLGWADAVTVLLESAAAGVQGVEMLR